MAKDLPKDKQPVSWTADKVVIKLGRSDAKLLSQSVLLEETAPPRAFSITVLVLSMLVISFLLWASFATFAEKAIAVGKIIPHGRVQKVEHRDGGRVEQLFVTEGDRVNEGDILLRFDGAETTGQVDRASVRVVTLSLELERARALAQARKPNFSNFAAVYGPLIADQTRAFNVAEANQRARIDLVNAQVDTRAREVTGYKREVEALTDEAAALEETSKIYSDLLKTGSGSRLRLLEAQQRHAAVLSDLAGKETSLARAEAVHLEMKARLRETRQEMSRLAFEQVATLNADYLEASATLAALEERLARTVLLAPSKGIVSGVTVFRRGEVVKSGETVMTIVPTEDAMVAEVKLPLKDVGHVRVGMPVLLRVESYKFGRQGGIGGKISQISADTFEDGNGEGYYKTRIALDKDYVGGDPESNRVLPGMTVTADIRTGEKSLMAYLVRPISQSLATAFTER